MECNFCGDEETQKHILECKDFSTKPNENNENEDKMPDYDEILKENTNNQIKITRKFIQNMEKRKNMARQ